MNIAAEQSGGRSRLFSDVVQIGTVAPGAADGFEGRTLLAVDHRQPEVQLMTDRAGLPVTVEAGHQALIVLVVGRVEHATPGAAVETGDGQ
ncbi:hypothetical protein D3C76_1474090 [compost metagenome]